MESIGLLRGICHFNLGGKIVDITGFDSPCEISRTSCGGFDTVVTVWRRMIHLAQFDYNLSVDCQGTRMDMAPSTSWRVIFGTTHMPVRNNVFMFGNACSFGGFFWKCSKRASIYPYAKQTVMFNVGPLLGEPPNCSCNFGSNSQHVVTGGRLWSIRQSTIYYWYAVDVLSSDQRPGRPLCCSTPTCWSLRCVACNCQESCYSWNYLSAAWWL